jgi:hypothetical protein
MIGSQLKKFIYSARYVISPAKIAPCGDLRDALDVGVRFAV